jgi:hypothetical protein
MGAHTTAEKRTNFYSLKAKTSETDPAPFFDGTYPNTVKSVIPKHFTDFQAALEAFQKAEGLKPYPLVGVKTRTCLNKYLNLIKYSS